MRRPDRLAESGEQQKAPDQDDHEDHEALEARPPEHLHVPAHDASSLRGKPSVNMNKGKIMRKLLGQPVLPATEPIDKNITSSPQLRPSASQKTTFYAGAPIACLDRSPNGQRAVVAGPKMFKILRVDGSTVTEDLDLRAVIASYATTHDLSAATPDQFNIKAVNWSHGALDTTIFTACGNGRITIYDLNRVGQGLEVLRIHEHARQVHKLAVNPFKGDWLLSASQDGTVRSFDIRSPGQDRPIFRVLSMFKCNADAVRDIKWSPTDGMEFACSTDAGVVQKWDFRKATAPLLKITAHQTSCFSIAWHPDGTHLVSGGVDQHCHVWDMKADRNQKPRYSFATPAPVSSVSWRPACWSATARGKRAAQITVSYDDTSATKMQNSTVHLWDLARPSLPFKEIEEWDTAPTGLLWNTRDLLWSVDKSGHFSQTDVAFSRKVIESRSLSTFSFSSNGDALMVLEERQIPRRRSRPSIASAEASTNFQHSNVPLLSVSRSDSEEDVVGSFLGSRQRKPIRRRDSGRSAQSFSTTPPTNTPDNKAMSLDEAVRVTGIYKSQQVMAIGHLPSAVKRSTYQYFTNRYLMRLAKYSFSDSDRTPTDVRIASISESFARTAEGAGHYRLAQTWRLLGYTMNLLLTRRADYHRQARLTVPEPPPKIDKLKEQLADLTPRRTRGDETPRRWHRGQTLRNSPNHHSSVIIIPDEIESTSNVATPLVRPVQTHTAINVDNDILDLAESSLSTTLGPIPVPGAPKSGEEAPIIEGYDFYGIDSFPSLIVDYHPPQRKQPLRLEYPSQTSQQPIHPVLQRHDSGESFQMFSTSTESQQTKFLDSSSSDKEGSSLRDRISAWEGNLASYPRKRLDLETIAQSESSFEKTGTSLGAESSNTESSAPTIGMPYDPAVPPVFRLQEPSVQSESHNREQGPVIEVPLDTASTGKTELQSQDPDIVESDFLPRDNDPVFTITPLDPHTLIQRAIEFESQTGSLVPAMMILLFRSLLPLNTIDEIFAGATITQYHHRLTTMALFLEAALLRNLCTPLYPSIFAIAQQDVTSGFFCTSCSKPLENDPLIPNSVWSCPRCTQHINDCAICKHRKLEPNTKYDKADVTVNSALWYYCPGCGHGGHTACMQAWHSGPEFEEGSKHSDGSCPLEGCLHPCLPGKWRTQRWEEDKIAQQKKLESAVRENSRVGVRGGLAGRGGVKRDQREVNQSKAVEGVRIALAVGVDAGERSIERKKSVKLVAPGEEF